MSKFRHDVDKLMVQYEVFKDSVFQTAYDNKIRVEKQRPLAIRVSDRLIKTRALTHASAKLKIVEEDRIANPLKYYCPNKPCQEVIEVFGHCLEDSKVPLILVSTGNGVGKSEVSLQIISNLILGPKNGWFNYNIFKHFPFNKNIWYVSTPNVIQNRAMDEFFTPLFRRGQYKNTAGEIAYPEKVNMIAQKKGKNHTAVADFYNEVKQKVEWKIEFKTFDQPLKEFESSQPGIIIIDEPPPEGVFRACLARTRMGCIILMPMTPLDIEPFIWEMVIDNIEDGVKGYHMINGDVRDCSKKNSLQGHLDHSIMTEMITRYSPDEFEARVKGVPTHFKERIYSMYEEKKHKVSPLDFPILDALFYIQVIDPKDGAESAIIWMAYMPNTRFIVFTELPCDQSKPYWKGRRKSTAKKEVELMIEMEALYPEKTIYRIMDRHFGWQSRGGEGKTLAFKYLKAGKELGKKFFYFESYSDKSEEGEIAYGHDEVREMLNTTLDDGHPQLVIWDSCYHALNGMRKYIRKAASTKAENEKPTGGTKIVEKYKDFPDCVRYGVCSSFAEMHKSTTHTHTKKKKGSLGYGNRGHKKSRGSRGL